MQKITPFLWFDHKAEEAMLFYTSIFKNSKRGEVTRYGEGSPSSPSGVMTASFELDGVEYTALNGGPHYKLSPAFSIVVSCDTQEEADEIWDKLSEGGDPDAQQCGWLADKFGLSWQVFPSELLSLLRHENPEIAGKAMNAMMEMKKIDIQKLKAACLP